MRTLVISDLHLGSAGRVDLLRRAELREPLWRALDGVERLVLLGDVLELRHGPRREALAAARPFFEDLGRAFAGREVVVLAGNHDHALVEPWLAQRRELSTPGRLAAEQRFAARDASPTVAILAEWASPARLSFAYPGLWIRKDVYATHGHYLDCHLTVPTMERLGIAAVARMQRRPAPSFRGPDDYEAVTEPVFAWIDSMAQQARTGGTLNGASTVRAWRALGGGGGARTNPAAAATGLVGGSLSGVRGRIAARGTAARTRVLAGAFPLAVAALNRTGLGPFRADISSAELRRAGLRAMGEVSARLDLGDAHVIFGHTHRAGPLPGDDVREWLAPGGARLMNSGCWTYDSYFLTSKPGESPYWPGACVLVEDDGPPVLRRLLDDRVHADFAPRAAA